MAELPSWVDLGDHGIWQRPAEKPTVGQFFDQTWADAQRVSNQDANIRNYMEAFDAVNDRIRQATGEALDNPMAWSGGPIAALQAATAYSRQGVEQIDTVRDWRRRIGELRTKHPDKLPWDEIENEPSRLAWEKMRATREKTTEMSEAIGMVEGSQVPLVGKIPIAGPILGTGPAFLYNLAHSPRYTLAQLGAGFGAQMTSPLDATVNLMSFGAGGAAKSILRNAAINAAVNASGQALLSAPKQISYREAGLPYGWEVWANEVGSAAVMGGVIDAMVRYPARTLLRRYGRDVPAGEMFSKNTERAGFFTDLPKTLDLPERPPVRETENVSRETWDKAKAGDVEALREVATRTGAIEDPAVKGALDYAELGGAIDDAMIQRFREMGIDHGEGLRTVATVMANPERFARVPEVRSDGAPLLREEGHQLMARNEAEVRQVTAGLDARIARGVELGLEAGLPSVVAAVREAVARVGADGPDKARAGFLEALAKASEAMGGPQRMADHIAIHGSTDVLEVAAAMRRAPDLVDKTVPMGTDFARAAYAVSKLAEDAFARVAAGEVPAKIGELVANEVPPEHQARVLDDLKKAAPRSVQEARAMLDDLLPSEQPRSEMPLDGGAKVDDPAGPEAKAQTERLVEEHAEAIAEAEAPIKERKKLESRIEDLKGEIAKLEMEANEGKLAAIRDGDKLAAIAPEPSKLSQLRRELLDAENQLLALKAERVADDPSALYRLVMESAAVRRQRDLDDAIRSALGFAGRVLPEGTAVEVKPDAQMIHVGKDGTRYQLDATSDPRTGEIALALHALDPAARIGHEGVHTLVTLGHISPEELASIAKAAREAGVFGNEAKYREAYKDRPNLEALIEEEAAAHLIEAVVAGKVKVDLPATLLDHIKALIERIRSYLNGAGFHTPEDVIHAILSGEAARRTARDAWMRKQDYSAVAVKNEPLAALADGDALTIADKIANIESASAALERLPRNGRRPLNDAYDLITSPSVGRAIYYVVLKGKPLEDRRGNIKAIGRFDVKPAQRIDVAGVEVTNARVDERHQRKGIASAAYEAIANDMADVGGLSPSPRDQLSPDAQSFWSKRLGHQMFAFAGERARTADHDALAQAKRMEGDGKPREAIWTETGWFRGVDGKWRFEIDDSAFAATVRIRPSGYLDNLSSTLGMGGILRHDALVAAYPDLARTRVVQTATTDRTFYGYGDKEFIDGKWRDAPEKTVQIGIPQYREEWLRGARKGETADVNEPLPGNFEAVSLRSMGMHELQHAAQGQEGFYLDGASSSAVAQRSIADYRRMANEVEARTVQKRMDMTGADRRARPPWLDYDVPEDQQIVRFADGKSVSATELNELKSGHSPRSGALFAINDDDGKIVAFPSRKMPEGYRPAEARDVEAVVMDALTRPALTAAEILQAVRPISTFMTQRYGLTNMKMPIRDPHAYGNTVLAMARAFRSLEENIGQTPQWPALGLYVRDRGMFRVFDDGYDVRGGIEIPVGASQKKIEDFFRDSGIWHTRRPPDNDLFAIRTPLHDEMEFQDRMGMLADLARACR